MTEDEARKIIAVVAMFDKRAVELRVPGNNGGPPPDGFLCSLAEYLEAWEVMREATREAPHEVH